MAIDFVCVCVKQLHECLFKVDQYENVIFSMWKMVIIIIFL